MSESELAAKARRAAEWLNEPFEKPDFCVNLDLDGWGIYAKFLSPRQGEGWVNCPHRQGLTDSDLIAFAEGRGWQEQDSKPPEFVEVKGVESATFAQDQEADGVEWKTYEEFAPCNGGTVTVKIVGNQFRWIAGIPGKTPIRGSAKTRAEARRQAVEAARGMG